GASDACAAGDDRRRPARVPRGRRDVRGARVGRGEDSAEGDSDRRGSASYVGRTFRSADVPDLRGPAYFTSLSGITSARGSGPKSSPNFTGGRSWNMKSHFQRSDGFDAWSQLRAEMGRAKVMPASAPYAGMLASDAAIASRTAGPEV